MKVFFNLLLLILLFNNFAFSQEIEKVLANADYKLTHHYDTLNYDHVHYENYISIISANSVIFKCIDKELQDSAMMMNFRKTGSMMPVSNEKYNEEILFLNTRKKEMFTTSGKLIGDFIVKRNFPNIRWRLESEKKLLLGYQCQKATCSFRGRNYTAWFTQEIPVNAALGKFNGLPGLIVFLEDETKRIKYELTAFVAEGNLKKYTESEKELISWEKYMHLVRFLKDDPYGFLSQRLGRKINFGIPPKPMNHNPLLPKSQINFPLETLDYYTKE